MNDIKLEIAYRKSINYSLMKNGVKPVCYVRILNETEEDYDGAVLKIECSPAFSKSSEIDINLAAGKGIEIDNINIDILGDYFANLSEKVVGNLLFSVIAKVKNEEGTAEDRVIAEKTETIEILPYNQWGGISEMPQFLASFVMPNHPSIANMIPMCAKQLEEWKRPVAITGYLTQDKNDTKYQMAAAYEVLRKEGIAYAISQTSFETVGQRIRTPDEVFGQKLGNCIEMSCIYAAMLESMGLNPLIILKDNHAFVGCWLENRTFVNCVEDDISALSKRCAEGIDELLFVECTAMTAGEKDSFEDASVKAKDLLFNEETFKMAIDVKRCRNSRIYPLPSRVMENGEYKVVEFKVEKEAEKPKKLSTRGINAEAVENVMTKQKLWERKLLDLSLRNPLINFRVSRSFVQLAVVDLARLEDELVNGKALTVHSCKEEMSFKPGEDKIYKIPEIKELLKTNEEDDFTNGRIRSFLDDKALEAGMKQLSRQAKLSLEENGSNTLYLAIGFLKWFENDISTKERYSPLILVPIDVTKKIIDKNYRISIRDEEAIVNVTLLEFLRQNFGIDIGGLDPLPRDESGMDIQLILNIIRKSVMGKAHWDVCDYAFVGIFSFSRFIMWNDLKNRADDIAASKVVSSLISGKLEWEPIDLTDEMTNLDERVKPSDMAVVCSADESQMKAIRASALGESFVLHGPPGTGKSQTITNMIANALYNGKRVLFVAEKMAALSVVQSRLEKVGLGPFCLELHSNKAQKQAVLSQLERTLQAAGTSGSENFEAKAEELYSLRCKMNEVMTQLHRKTACNRSVYELIGDYENNSELEGILSFTNDFVARIDEKAYSEIINLLNEYCILIDEVGEVENHPLKEYYFTSYSKEIREDWLNTVTEFSASLDTVKKDILEVMEVLEIDSPAKFRREFISWLEMSLKKGAGIVSFPPEADTLEEFQRIKSNVSAKIQANIDLQKIRNELLKRFKPGILTYDYVGARKRYVEAQGKWILSKKSEIGALVKEMKFLSLNPSNVTEEGLNMIYDRIELHGQILEAARLDDITSVVIGGLFAGDKTDWNLVEDKVNNLESYLTIIDKCPDDELKRIVASKIVNAYASDKKEVLKKFVEDGENAGKIESKLITEYGLKIYDFADETDYIQAMKKDILIAKDNEEEVRSYSSLCEVERKMAQKGLAEGCELVRNGKLYPDDLVNAFICNFGKTAAIKAVGESEILKNFSGASFTAMIAEFKNMSDEFESLTKKEVVARLSANIPKVGKDVAASSEIGILQRAIKSGRRAVPIRKLFNEIPTLLTRMCPCMLMSPISVAQYIDPSFPKFDLVIFDEASQLPTSEAVGVLARAENAIVVGDPKQLPPTSFFMTNHEEEDEYEFADMESLLDDCLAISMPGEHLLWHYRSRHESLIAFSNMMYYDNKLYTFPSPNDLVSEVKLVQAGGSYDRGKRKVNKAEAELIVNEIMERLRDPERRNDSIGVVTFSQVQQAYIEDLLQDALHEDPDIALFAQGLEEPIFVKNLENVQGDERDVILFSICYGPDENGKVSMNFGPLNQDGGWRRLNVAISRARKSMIIYSTIRPEQIDISRTSAEGVIGLRGFLEFAALGNKALYAKNELNKKRNINVARKIKDRLRHDGYTANLNVGSSEYHLDLGVVDPKDENKYCLGILLDGENYLAGDSAKDRNVLQPSVLEGLGWKLHRVWTLDWFDTPDKEYERIVDAIKNAMNPEKTEVLSEAKNETEEEAEQPVMTEEGESPARRIYESYIPSILGDNEDFFSPGHDKRIVREAENIMNVEAPIAKKALFKKVLSAYGITRQSKKTEDRLEDLLRAYPMKTTTSANEQFYWLDSQNPQTYDIYRVGSEDSIQRPINEIPAEELINAVIEVMKRNVSVPMEGCIKETGKIFGVNKMTQALDSSVRVAVSYAEQRGNLIISDEGDKVIYKD